MIRLALPWALAATPVVAAILWLAAPRRGRPRRALRALAAALVLLAIANPLVSEPHPRNNVVFLVDRSPSVARTMEARALEDAVRRVASAHPSWNYGVVDFASSARIVAPLGSRELALPASLPDGEETDLEQAIRLALSLLPDGGANQLVLLSDGRSSGAIAEAALAARDAGVPISCVQAGRELATDLQLVEISAPGESSTGRPFPVTVKLSASEACRATLALYRSGTLVAHREIDLTVGTTSQTFVESLGEPGLYEYRAVIKRGGDEMPENDARSTLVRTTDHPSVLLVDPSGVSVVPQLLDAIGVPYVAADAVPALSSLADYRQVVITGIPLADVTAQASTRLEQFVTNLGGGLLVIHGEGEVRGFQGGAIESLLPVAYEAPETERNPSLAVVYLLDRSGSMSELVGPKTKIRILREAAIASILLLPPETLVGLIAFSDQYSWTVPLAPLDDAATAFAAVQNIFASGGTDIYYPLSDAVDRIGAAEARVKHILLISDGKTTMAGRDYPGLLTKLRTRPDITLSVIAVSLEPNIELLRALVDAGRGELYFVDNFLNLPEVTMQVTQRLSRSRFITGDVAVTSAFGNVAAAAPPHIGGYVLTHPRSSSSTLLWAGQDPLFATWRVGLGSVSALNTDLAGKWTADWLAWPELPALFAAMLKTTEPLVETAGGAYASVEVAGDTASLLLDVRNPDGTFVEFARFEGELLPEESELEISQVAPGLYQSTFARPNEGGHAIVARDLASGRPTIVPFSVPYLAEYARTGADAAALADIAAFTGGAVLDATPLAEARASGSVSRSLAPVLLACALAVFLLDLAVSRRPRVTPAPTEGDGAA